MENVRIMRQAAGPGRPFVITFLGSFHGGNYGTGAMGPHNAHYNHGIEPFMSGWINVPFPTCYRCPYHLDYPACDIACLGYIEEMILRYKATPDSIAGVNVEFIQGENGIQIPPPEWPGRLSALCKKYDWILYNDEVQEGMGRCGEWFLVDAYPDVEVELLSLGKATSGGLIPICYTLGSARMSEPAGELYTGGTFAGSPVGCAVGIKLIEIITRDHVLDNVKEIERVAKAKFGAMKDKYEIVGDVRVKGCYQCVEFVEDKDCQDAGPRPHPRGRLRHGAARRHPDLRAGVQLVPAHAGAQHVARAVRARLRHRGRMRGRGEQSARERHRMTYDSLPFSGIATFFKAPLVRLPTTADADVAVVGIGWDEGTTSRSGARMGPRALREASTMYAFQRDAEPFGTARPAWNCSAASAGPTPATSRSAPCGRPSATTMR